ncbi:MAG: sulfide-dependent adenosine diphosphate thiazole synthase [Candidatus Omnitrophica bacterium]|nr:sulfide-dependent adenosine diphosphate thiazole synthase [Candidatus Omnitrophota bacterium]MDD5441497.1 sulfide-dependent adenosine diphosphate thiazole synthase [Candidatus Omnitrophota bacterium]
MLDEILISKGIIEKYFNKITDSLDVDVAIVGAGPSGMLAAYYLAKAGKKVVLFEKKLTIGGGMPGGGMLFNEIVVQAGAKPILDELGVRITEYKKDYFLADAIECSSSLAYHAVNAGATILNCIMAEDVMVKNGKVCGLVINWSPVNMAGLHVDPLTIRAKVVVDSTGHPCEVVGVVERKSGLKLNTPTGKILWEKSMDADVAEGLVVDNTKEVCPGLYVCGMAANAVYGTPRMGPIFGGMLLSGKKLSEILIAKV